MTEGEPTMVKTVRDIMIPEVTTLGRNGFLIGTTQVSTIKENIRTAANTEGYSHFCEGL